MHYCLNEVAGIGEYIGKKLIPEYQEKYSFYRGQYFVTRPDNIGPSTHINMCIHIDRDFVITMIDGDKCYSQSRGLYNRSATVRDGHFTAKDLAYLKKFLKAITTASPE